ncbi:plasmid IncI1-type surface exclusion protein ExcA [Salmonella enterica subsp. enterica serovar Legon]|nr:plasmid IncI1-type surface exclusion protein ExcA [Salmonella enterica subsp. enterica serovar Legon]EDW9825500.1 plasmid IncI1-type surface exclusion protein ExcA [Salmonella enterica]EDZ3589492.1 plasmid IncI1-type surface exclusion protein ExcA [Salmonella enterica subsp. enterica serovar Wagenia]
MKKIHKIYILGTYFCISLPIYLMVGFKYFGHLSGFLCWLLLAMNFVGFSCLRRNRRKTIDAIVANIKATGQFVPGYEVRSDWDIKYMGIDTHNGTILYIGIRLDKDYIDVIGFDARGFLQTQYEGYELTCHTKLVSSPVISIKTKKITQDLIYMMTSRHYDHSAGFFNLVKDKRKELEKLAGTPIPEAH